MSAKSRTKGSDFERLVAKMLRDRWEHEDLTSQRPSWEPVTVYRSHQADAAYQPDLVILGGPPVCKRLWLELHHADQPVPLDKLDQAEHDVGAVDVRRLPVVIWRKTRGAITATMRLETLRELAGWPLMGAQCVWPHVVSMSLDDFLDIVETAR